MISERKLKFWLENDLNVLLVGRHGVGKSTIVADLFNEEGLNWKYFSAATMDPWVDFIGVPKEAKNKNGDSHLELIPPKDFATDDVEAIFIDEFNRAHKKVRNAVMELIQFKSINGRSFDNLKVIWAAINPDDDPTQSYDVEPLDPAQKDRFQIHVELPYRPSRTYFSSKYGDEVGQAALEWWNNLNEEAQDKVSPRRLDYALKVHYIDGSMRDVLPRNANVRQLQDLIQIGAPSQLLQDLHENGDSKEIKNFFENENKYRSSIDLVKDNESYIEAFLPHLPAEKISSLVSQEEMCLNLALRKEDDHPILEQVLDDIVDGMLADEKVTKKITWQRKVVNNPDAIVYQGKYLDRDAETLEGSDSCDLATYRQYIKDVDQDVKNSRSSTHDRVKGVRKLVYNFPGDRLEEQDVKECLSVVNIFAKRSQTSTLNKVADFVPFVNALILQYVDGDEDKFENFCKTYRRYIFLNLKRMPGFCCLEV